MIAYVYSFHTYNDHQNERPSPSLWMPTPESDNPSIYYLKETAIVLVWSTRQGRKITTWVRDVLNNVWIVLDDEKETK